MQGHAKSGHGRFMINIQQSTRLFVFRFLIEKDRMEIFRRNHLYRNSPGGNRALLQQQCLVQIMRSDEDIVRNHDDALSLARKAVEKTVECMLKPDVVRTGWFIQKAGSAYPVQRRRRAASEVRIPTGISCGAATVRADRRGAGAIRQQECFPAEVCGTCRRRASGPYAEPPVPQIRSHPLQLTTLALSAVTASISSGLSRFIRIPASSAERSPRSSMSSSGER